MYLFSYARAGGWSAAIGTETCAVDVGTLLNAGPISVRQLLALGPPTLARIWGAAESELATAKPLRMGISDPVMGPPVPDPDKIICVGLNYRQHAHEAGAQIPTSPILFAKFRNSLVGPTAPIVLPPVGSEFDYEGELAVVIGSRCKSVPKAAALEYVAGYSVFNDVSARDLQSASSQWTAGKAIDTFGPMGPGIVPGALLGDPQSLRITTTLNGQAMQDASTADMIFTIAEIVEYTSAFMTLEPGDIIATGTPSGVGIARRPQVLLKAGDLVEVSISGIGTIANRVEDPSRIQNPG